MKYATIAVLTLAFCLSGCGKTKMSGVYQAQGFIQFQGSNPRLEFLSDGRVKRTNDEGIGLIDTYSVANDVVTVTSATPAGNHFLEFRKQGDDLVLSTGQVFKKR